MFWKKDTVKFYCVIISHRTNNHNDSCRVWLGQSEAAMIWGRNEEEIHVLDKRYSFILLHNY